MDRHDRQSREQPEEEIASVTHPSFALNNFGRIIFIVVLVEIILMIFLNLYQKSRLKTLETALVDRQAQLSSAEYKTINNQVNEVLDGSQKLQAALSSRVKWSKFYSQLNAVTPKDVRLTSLSISENGAFKADGETASLTSLAQAVVAWRDGTSSAPSPFASITLSNNGYNTSSTNKRVTFSMSGQLNMGGLQ